MSTSSQVSELLDGRLDLGFLRQTTAELASLRCELSFSEPFAIAVPSDHSLCGRASVTLAEIADEPFVLFPRRVAPGLFRQLLELFNQAGFTPRVVQEAQEWLTIIGLVDAGVGLSIVPASFRRLQWGFVHYVQLAKSDVRTTVSVCGPAHGLGPTAQRFVDVTRATIQETFAVGGCIETGCPSADP